MYGPIFVQNNAGSLTAFLAEDGVGVTGLVFSDVTVDFRKAGGSFVNKVLADQATASIGTGANGTVEITVDAAGAAGNSYTVEVVVPGGTSALSASLTGTAITVSLSVNVGVPVAADNTATLVAAAVDALTGVSATATGTGADSLSLAEGPTSFTGGADYFTELGGGFYEIDFSASNLDTTGNFLVRVTGGTIDTTVLTAYVATAAPSSSNPVASPPATTTIFGWLYDGTGVPVEDAGVSVRVLSTPAVLHSSSEGSVLSSDLISTKTDSSGFFSLSLVVGSTVDVLIPAANYRRVVVIPATSSNIFDIA